MVSIWFSINICMDMHLPHGIPSVFGATIESATLDLPIANMFDESWMCLVFYLYLFIFKLLIICIWHGILPVICVGYHNFHLPDIRHMYVQDAKTSNNPLDTNKTLKTAVRQHFLSYKGVYWRLFAFICIYWQLFCVSTSHAHAIWCFNVPPLDTTCITHRFCNYQKMGQIWTSLGHSRSWKYVQKCKLCVFSRIWKWRWCPIVLKL